MQNLAAIQKKYRNWQPPQGKTLIYAVVQGDYEFFGPLFKSTAKAAFPECDVQVNLLADFSHWLNPLGEHSWPKRMASAFRFTNMPMDVEKYDYILITDVDIVFAPEKQSIAKTHLQWMETNGTKCYDNWLLAHEQCPGVHFVTKEWWAATAEARKKEEAILRTMSEIPYFYDEKMLFRIIRDSGLPLPGRLPHPWSEHGLHLGACRNFAKQRHFEIPRPDGVEVLLSGQFDAEIAIAVDKFPWLGEFIKYCKKR